MATNDSSLLTSTTAHPMVFQKLAGEARDNLVLGEQRARQLFESFNADAYSLCLWIEIAIPIASGNSGCTCIGRAAESDGI